jgi:hypothetical protein
MRDRLVLAEEINDLPSKTQLLMIQAADPE